MKTLVRPSGTIKPKGEISYCYITKNLAEIKKSEHLAIVDNEGNTLNIAKVIRIVDDKIMYTMLA
jgi:hypothetical protein